MFLKNEQINLLIKMENLIGMNAKKLFGKDKTKVVKFGETEITFEDFISYMNLIENIFENQRQLNDRSNNYNKKNAERHRILNAKSDAKKRGNRERYNYWNEKLKELNKGVGKNESKK